MKPQTDRLTKGYLDHQVQRNLKTIERILGRPSVPSGRVIPESGDIAIHDGRRLSATVMFLDICKFSSRPSSSVDEQENLLRTLSLFFSEMIRIVEDYDGVIEKNTGDGLMAYFSEPSSSGVPVQQQAVAAALTMFYAAKVIVNPILSRSGFLPLEFRICMDHGPITVAKVGAAKRFNGIVAIGATANIACKMLSVADPNTILLGDAMLPGLPFDWRSRFVTLKKADTGWTYTLTGQSYPFWQYDGRWAEAKP